MLLNPSILAAQKNMMQQNITCIKPIDKAAPLITFKCFGFNPMPTMNSSKLIPICEKVFKPWCG